MGLEIITQPPFYKIVKNRSVWEGKWTQQGTDAPIVTVYENTLGEDIVWTRFNTGEYRGTVTRISWAEDVFIECTHMMALMNDVPQIRILRKTDKIIEVVTGKIPWYLTDNLMNAYSWINIKITNKR